MPKDKYERSNRYKSPIRYDIEMAYNTDGDPTPKPKTKKKTKSSATNQGGASVGGGA